MIEFLSAIMGGFAANQLDEPIMLLKSPGWELIARYIAGTLTIMFFSAMVLRRLNPDALKDGIMANAAASAGVGLGVVMARIVKDLTGVKK